MSTVRTIAERPKSGGIEGLVRFVFDPMVWVAMLVAPIVLRFALATPFLRSGLTRWEGFLALAPSTVYLFTEEFKLHILGGVYAIPAPATVSLLTACAEIILPILLMLGLATRFAALGLLIMTGVIQLVMPDGWANFHLLWAGLALAIMAIGPGPLSLDWVFGKLFPQWKPRVS